MNVIFYCLIFTELLFASTIEVDEHPRDKKLLERGENAWLEHGCPKWEGNCNHKYSNKTQCDWTEMHTVICAKGYYRSGNNGGSCIAEANRPATCASKATSTTKVLTTQRLSTTKKVKPTIPIQVFESTSHLPREQAYTSTAKPTAPHFTEPKSKKSKCERCIDGVQPYCHPECDDFINLPPKEICEKVGAPELCKGDAFDYPITFEIDDVIAPENICARLGLC